MAGIDSDPFIQFGSWFRAAHARNLPAPNAMALATATRTGVPSVRMVLLKGFDARGFTFFTNYESQKARELDENPVGSLLFYWPALERQVRVSGSVARISHDESAAYFATRARGSQIAAWASKQSRVIASREMLEAEVERLTSEYEGRPIPLPPFWGGFRLVPARFEFWIGRPDRLHERYRYERSNGGAWRLQLLSP